MEHKHNCQCDQEERHLNPSECEETNSAYLLEQYKLYVEMADRVSQRREQSNRFYAGLLASMIALMAVLARLDISNDDWAIVILCGGLFGCFLSVVWLVNIRSYRVLSTAKFAVINELEESLPAQGYSKEWALLRPSDGSAKYFQLTRIEQFVPVMMFLLFLGLAVYSVFRLLS